MSWVNKINHLYHLNNQRIQNEPETKIYAEHHQALKEAVTKMQTVMDEALLGNELLSSARKLFVSLKKHWAGLTVFVENPEIPMDNNTTERGLRGSVLGSYGSSLDFEVFYLVF